MASGRNAVTVDVELRIAGESVGGFPLVVGPQDHLVVHLGPRATDELMAKTRAHLERRWPHLSERVVISRAESIAVVHPGD